MLTLLVYVKMMNELHVYWIIIKKSNGELFFISEVFIFEQNFVHKEKKHVL